MAYDVTGKSIKQLKKLKRTDLEKMEKSEVRAIVQRIASAANKRLKRMTEAGVTTSAVTELEESGGKITTKGKNKKELIDEFERAKEYINNPHSTLRVHKIIVERTKKKLEKMTGKEIDDLRTEKIIDIVDKLEENNPEILLKKEYRYEVMEQVKKEVEKGNIDFDSIYAEAKRWWEEKYKEKLREKMKFEENASDYLPPWD